MYEVVRLAACATLAVLVLPAAPAAAEYFHLSQNGVCNRTEKPVSDVYVDVDLCDDHCHCKVDASGGAGTYASPVTLAPGACGTATIELGEGCSASVTVYAGPGDVVGCTYQLSVSPTGNKTIENRGCRQGTDFVLEPHDGDEHFQLDIRPKS